MSQNVRHLGSFFLNPPLCLTHALRPLSHVRNDSQRWWDTISKKETRANCPNAITLNFSARRGPSAFGRLREEAEFDCSDDRTSVESQFPKAPRVAAVDSTGRCRFVAKTMARSIFGHFYGRRRGMELTRVEKMGWKL